LASDPATAAAVIGAAAERSHEGRWAGAAVRAPTVAAAASASGTLAASAAAAAGSRNSSGAHAPAYALADTAVAAAAAAVGVGVRAPSRRRVACTAAGGLGTLTATQSPGWKRTPAGFTDSAGAVARGCIRAATARGTRSRTCSTMRGSYGELSAPAAAEADREAAPAPAPVLQTGLTDSTRASTGASDE